MTAFTSGPIQLMTAPINAVETFSPKSEMLRADATNKLAKSCAVILKLDRFL
jgi:hypothetical protein